MLIIKRKLYSSHNIPSSKSSMRIKRFSQIREEERLYVSTIAVPRMIRRTSLKRQPSYLNNMRLNRIKTNGVKPTTSFRDTLSRFGNRVSGGFNNIRSKVGTGFTNFGNRVSGGFNNIISKVGTGFTNFGNKISGGFNSFRDTLSAKLTGGVIKPQIKPQTSIKAADISGVIGIKPTNQKLVTNPNISSYDQTILDNLNKSQNTFTVPRKYNPSADPKMYNKDQLSLKPRDISANKHRGQQYYNQVFKETGADANSMSNTTLSRSKVIEQQNNPIKTEPQKPIQPQSKPQPETPKQPTTIEKPIEITGMAEQQPKTETPTGPKKRKIAEVPGQAGSSTAETQTFEKSGLTEQPKIETPTVESNTSSTSQTTPPSAEPKQEVKPEASTESQQNQNNTNTNTTMTTNTKPEDQKFKLGWKGKAALGLGGLGLATYGAGKLVKNVLDDD